jgi:hypothetical protein
MVRQLSLRAADLWLAPQPQGSFHNRAFSTSWPILRQALFGDIPELLDLEKACFPGDIISDRSWRGLIASPAAKVAVAENLHGLFGDYVVLFNARTSVARLYSIAVAPA